MSSLLVQRDGQVLRHLDADYGLWVKVKLDDGTYRYDFAMEDDDGVLLYLEGARLA